MFAFSSIIRQKLCIDWEDLGIFLHPLRIRAPVPNTVRVWEPGPVPKATTPCVSTRWRVRSDHDQHGEAGTLGYCRVTLKRVQEIDP